MQLLYFDTVDGRNSAPVDVVDITVSMSFITSQVVQDFFHQQYFFVAICNFFFLLNETKTPLDPAQVAWRPWWWRSNAPSRRNSPRGNFHALLMAEIPRPTTRDVWNTVNHGMNYLSTGAGFLNRQQYESLFSLRLCPLLGDKKPRWTAWEFSKLEVIISLVNISPRDLGERNGGYHVDWLGIYLE